MGALRRSQIEKIYRNLDIIVRWIEYLAEYPH
nr:MAG TPA: Lambda Phage CIII [Caudoviricetes sp.]